MLESNGSASSDHRYCYDALDHLRARNTTAACTIATGDETYTYDDAGNRLTAPGDTFTYSPDGQLCQVDLAGPCPADPATWQIRYDTAGRTSSYSGWTFAYDSAGRMTSACRSATCAAGFDKVEMAYDGEGHRTRITETSAAGAVATTDFRYQGDAVVSEVSGSITRDFVLDDQGTARKLTITGGADAGTYVVVWNGHGDATGLWRVEADGTLTLANSFTYDTWGRPTLATHNGIADLGFRYQYVGASDVQWDDSFGLGLLYMHARHYSPALGRFLQPDPIAAESNLYWYAGNSPITKVDPSGTFLDTILDGIFVVVDLVAVAIDPSDENKLALGADVAFAFVPFATGGGLAVRAARAALTKAGKLGKLFAKYNIKITNHALSRLAWRTRQARITEELAVRAYCKGSLFYDTVTRRYIRHDNVSKVWVAIDGGINGTIVTIARGNRSPRWVPIRWRPGC